MAQISCAHPVIPSHSTAPWKTPARIQTQHSSSLFSSRTKNNSSDFFLGPALLHSSICCQHRGALRIPKSLRLEKPCQPKLCPAPPCPQLRALSPTARNSLDTSNPAWAVPRPDQREIPADAQNSPVKNEAQVGIFFLQDTALLSRAAAGSKGKAGAGRPWAHWEHSPHSQHCPAPDISRVRTKVTEGKEKHKA